MSLPGLDAPPPISLGPEQSLSYTGDNDPPSWLLLEQCVVLSSADMTMNVFVGVSARAVGEGGKEGGLRLISYAPDYVIGKRLPLLHEKTINHPTHVLLYMHATHRDIPPPSPPPTRHPETETRFASVLRVSVAPARQKATLWPARVYLAHDAPSSKGRAWLMRACDVCMTPC